MLTRSNRNVKFRYIVGISKQTEFGKKELTGRDKIQGFNKKKIPRYPHFKLLLFVFIGNLIVHGESTYGPWGEWSDCEVSEGQGMMTRTRKCVATNCPQPGEYRDEMRCFVKPCNCECAGEFSNKIPAASKLHKSPSPLPPRVGYSTNISMGRLRTEVLSPNIILRLKINLNNSLQFSFLFSLFLLSSLSILFF